jgi:predicted transcriptional regulator
MPDQEKLVREVMIDVFEFPHVPYWFTLRQVSGILKKSIRGGKCLRPLAVLVFDEKYNLLGHVEAKDILHHIGSTVFAGEGKHEGVISSPEAETKRTLEELSEKPASTFLHQSKVFVDPEDPVSRAAEMMLQNDLLLLPVLENQKKLVGVVRNTEIFEYLTGVFFGA